MSLTAAFNNASSGLTVALRAASVTSSNIANALTKGYARREISIEAAQEGGARSANVTRQLDQRILSQLRLASADSSGSTETVKYQNEIGKLWGEVDQPGSLFTRITDLETATQSLATYPDQPVRQEQLQSVAISLSEKFNTIADGLQNIRQDADEKIQSIINGLNEDLQKVKKLNASIASLGGKNAASLEDQRQSLIDQISDVIPIRQVARPSGTVALVTTKGQFLLDDIPLKLKFSSSGLMTSDKTVQNGGVSLPELDGSPLKIPDTGLLSSLINVRDQLAPDSFTMLNQLADHLTAASASQNGESLFTISNPGSPVQTLEVTADLPNPNDLLTALNSKVTTPFGNATFADHAFSVANKISTNGVHQEKRLAAANATTLALQQAHGVSEVDTDTELQSLLRFEKVYAANAKALQAVTTLLDDLLEIG